MKKAKRFQDGGVADENFTAAQLEFLGGADRTDPYILARMREAAPDAPKETVKETSKRESFDTTEGQNKNIGDDTRARAIKSVASTEASFKPNIKNSPVTEARKAPAKQFTDAQIKQADEDYARTQARYKKAFDKAEDSNKKKPKEEPKKTVKTTIPSDFGKVSLPKSFAESGGNTEPKKSTARLSPISLPDPLAKFKRQKGDKDTAYSDAGFKKGGVVKSSSASKRADGCAVRGKTRA